MSFVRVNRVQVVREKLDQGYAQYYIAAISINQSILCTSDTGIVTSASIAGQREYNIALAKAVRAHIKSHPAEFGASDSNAPEADDEVGTDEVNPERAEKEAVATGSHSPSFRTIVSDPFGNQNLPLTILALSNIALLIFILLTWSFSGKATKVTKSVMSAVNEQEAIVRLQRLETSWAKFKQCVDILTKDDI